MESGFASAYESNGVAFETPAKALAGEPGFPRLSNGLRFSWSKWLYVRALASDLTLASGCAKFSGISVV